MKTLCPHIQSLYQSELARGNSILSIGYGLHSVPYVCLKKPMRLYPNLTPTYEFSPHYPRTMYYSCQKCGCFMEAPIQKDDSFYLGAPLAKISTPDVVATPKNVYFSDKFINQGYGFDSNAPTFAREDEIPILIPGESVRSPGPPIRSESRNTLIGNMISHSLDAESYRSRLLSVSFLYAAVFIFSTLLEIGIAHSGATHAILLPLIAGICLILYLPFPVCYLIRIHAIKKDPGGYFLFVAQLDHPESPDHLDFSPMGNIYGTVFQVFDEANNVLITTHPIFKTTVFGKRSLTACLGQKALIARNEKTGQVIVLQIL